MKCMIFFCIENLLYKILFSLKQTFLKRLLFGFVWFVCLFFQITSVVYGSPSLQVKKKRIMCLCYCHFILQVKREISFTYKQGLRYSRFFLRYSSFFKKTENSKAKQKICNNRITIDCCFL